MEVRILSSAPTERARSSFTIVVALVSAGLFIRALAIAWPFTLDDSFITFRYASNLARGFGPTFNAGQPVEGYTSVAWLVVMAIPHALGANPEIFAKLTGVVCVIACMLLSARWSRDVARDAGGSPVFAVSFALLSLAAGGSAAVHAVSGMETALAALLFTAFLFTTDSLLRAFTRRTLIGVAVLGLAASLTRPEMIVPVAVALACVLVMERTRAQATAVASLVFLALPFAAYQAWRVTYYGHLWPLPFYVKVQTQTLAGLPQVRGFLVFIASYFGLPLLAGAMAVRRSMLPAVAAVVVLVAILARPAPLMAPEWRYLFPVMPFVIVVASAGVSLMPRLLTAAGVGVIASRVATAGLVAAIVGALAWNATPRLREARQYGLDLAAAHETLGAELARVPKRGVLAIADAGAVPYFSGWQTIDTYGLNDVRVAVTHHHDAAETLDRHPDVLVVISSDDRRFQAILAWEADLYYLADARGFLVAATRVFEPGYYLWVLADSATAPGRAALAALRRDEIHK